MSSNVGIFVRVDGLRDDREQAGIASLMIAIINAEFGSDAASVAVTLRGEPPELNVVADSGNTLVVVSQFATWRRGFEHMVTTRVTTLVPHATLAYEWKFDDDHQ